MADPSRTGGSVTVTPKRPADGRGVYDVQLDLTIVEPLFHMRQEDAAKFLGISLTSLKKACRALGIQRWPYARLRDGKPAGRPQRKRNRLKNKEKEEVKEDHKDRTVENAVVIDDREDEGTGKATGAEGEKDAQDNDIEEDEKDAHDIEMRLGHDDSKDEDEEDEEAVATTSSSSRHVPSRRQLALDPQGPAPREVTPALAPSSVSSSQSSSEASANESSSGRTGDAASNSRSRGVTRARESIDNKWLEWYLSNEELTEQP